MYALVSFVLVDLGTGFAMYPSLFQGPTKCSGEQVKVVKI
jgi:hypothetical protein